MTGICYILYIQYFLKKKALQSSKGLVEFPVVVSKSKLYQKDGEILNKKRGILFDMYKTLQSPRFN